MKNTIESAIQQHLRDILTKKGIPGGDFSLKIPRYSKFGEYSSTVALSVAKQAKIPPLKLAEEIAAEFPLSENEVTSAEAVKPGIINFRLSHNYLYDILRFVNTTPEKFGDSDEGAGQGRIFEFVSANPTGPLNVVSARAASIGDTLVRVFRKRGYRTTAEYYVNDGGRQVRLLGTSIKARLEQIKDGAETADIPDGGYHGEYVLDYARELRDEHPQIKEMDDLEIGKLAAEKIRTHQENILKLFRVEFDHWFRESSLYEMNAVKKVVDRMRQKDATYEKDGATFFKASEYGDNEDRVVIKSNGDFTYFVPDIAYHINKHDRGNEISYCLLGPDHHGAIIRMKAAMKSLGIPEEFYQAIMVQQVNLSRDGKEVKMSKRAGVGITLEDLIDEVGVDAARFFFLRRKTSTPLDFDIDLARKHSEENPVYYVQYAHARICSILRQPAAYEPDSDTDLSVLKEEEELEVLRTISRYPWTLDSIIRSVEPHTITLYLIDLAKAFHLFYTRHRVINDDPNLTTARLYLCMGVRALLREGLTIIGVSAPERM